MQIRGRLLLVLACSWLVPWAASLETRAQEIPENLQGIGLYDLGRVTRGAGLNAAETAEVFTRWMAVNDWRSLELPSLYNLYGWLNADSLDRRHFSARWSGFLTAPSTGAYTLRQVRQYSGTDSRIKVVLNGQTVLDSATDPSNPDRFSSAPLELTGGQAVPIQVTLVHDVTRIDFSEGAPMIVLTWQKGEGDETIIPTMAFTPPAGFVEGTRQGLKGEYFGNMEFGDLRLTRLDPALDLVWSWPPTASIHDEEAQQVLAACKAKLLDREFLARSAADGKEQVFHYTMWRVAYRMTASERQQLVEALLDNPEVLAAMTPAAMGRLMQGIYMLPSKDQLDLLGEWALARPQPRCEAGQFPGWGNGYYQQLNTDYYWLMGLFLQGPYGQDSQTLCDDYLARPNGECNLAVAYAAAYATRAETFKRDARQRASFLTRLQEHLEDDSVTGDTRVSWLLARAFAEEILNAGHPRLLQGSEHLAEARLVAESSDYQFWALQETAARYASLGEVERLNQLLGQQTGATSQQQAAIAAWREKAAALATVYAERRVQEKAKSQEAFVAELERRLALAQERQDEAEISRYRQSIEAVRPPGDE